MATRQSKLQWVAIRFDSGCEFSHSIGTNGEMHASTVVLRLCSVHTLAQSGNQYPRHSASICLKLTVVADHISR